MWWFECVKYILYFLIKCDHNKIIYIRLTKDYDIIYTKFIWWKKKKEFIRRFLSTHGTNSILCWFFFFFSFPINMVYYLDCWFIDFCEDIINEGVYSHSELALNELTVYPTRNWIFDHCLQERDREKEKRLKKKQKSENLIG